MMLECLHVKGRKCSRGYFGKCITACKGTKPGETVTSLPFAAFTIQLRRETCESCDHNGGITDMMGVVRVKCRKCTTCEGGRSLTAAGQACPIGKW